MFCFVLRNRGHDIQIKNPLSHYTERGQEDKEMNMASRAACLPINKGYMELIVFFARIS